MTNTNFKKQQRADKFAHVALTLIVVWVVFFLLMIPIAEGRSRIDTDLPGIVIIIISLIFFGFPIIGIVFSAVSLGQQKSGKGFMALLFHVAAAGFIIYLIKAFVDSFCVIC